MRNNAGELVRVSVMGLIARPTLPSCRTVPLDADGPPFLYPAHGSIVYNVSVGDPAYGWFADTIHPGVRATWWRCKTATAGTRTGTSVARWASGS